MKKLEQQGFSPIEGLLIAGIVAILGFIGWYVYQQSQKQDETSQPQSSTSVPATNTVTYDDADGLIITLDKPIELIKLGDEDNLPDDIPDSFVAYMHDELDKNAPDEYGCLVGYSVSRYSKVNISGGTGAVDENGQSGTENCFGGAAAFWYLKNGSWNLHATQSVDTCSAIKETTIYEEFIEKCLKNETDQNLSSNPNGSIEQTR